MHEPQLYWIAAVHAHFNADKEALPGRGIWNLIKHEAELQIQRPTRPAQTCKSRMFATKQRGASIRNDTYMYEALQKPGSLVLEVYYADRVVSKSLLYVWRIFVSQARLDYPVNYLLKFSTWDVCSLFRQLFGVSTESLLP